MKKSPSLRATAKKTAASQCDSTKSVSAKKKTASKPTKKKTTELAPQRRGTSDASVRRRQAAQIVAGLKELFPHAECALNHASPYELLAATILSAQCTDERVNQVTPALFAKFPSPRELAAAIPSDVEAIIHSTGFFRAKAANLIGMAQAVVDRFAGEIPRDLDSLITLPGVGRKTANVLLGVIHRLPSGVVVDTHVKRIARLIGLTDAASPEQIERDLMRLLPSEEWIDFSHRLIHHGRRTCIALRPRCSECALRSHCDHGRSSS